MKFTKEQAVEKLNQKLTNGGKKTLRMSARTLEAQTENLMALVGDEEMELDAFVDKVSPMLESVNANLEHDNSEFIKEYKKNNPAPKTDDGKKTDEGKQDDPLQKALDEVAAIKKQLQEREEKEAIEAKRREIRKYLEDNNVKDSKWIDSILSIATIGKDDDVEEKGKTYLGLYNDSKSEGKPITPKTPNSGGESGEDRFAAVRAAIKAEEEAGKGQ
ncbi:MAG: hypothetical protein J6Y20_04650 [Lachnospiraceae bacterium]|nr:hypothetical protein [Kiritimatiellia bacterium]MBP5461395.1 hypothetical protein [Lachnospiraceae bacterium]